MTEQDYQEGYEGYLLSVFVDPIDGEKIILTAPIGASLFCAPIHRIKASPSHTIIYHIATDSVVAYFEEMGWAELWEEVKLFVEKVY